MPCHALEMQGCFLSLEFPRSQLAARAFPIVPLSSRNASLLTLDSLTLNRFLNLNEKTHIYALTFNEWLINYFKLCDKYLRLMCSVLLIIVIS